MNLCAHCDYPSPNLASSYKGLDFGKPLCLSCRIIAYNGRFREVTETVEPMDAALAESCNRLAASITEKEFAARLRRNFGATWCAHSVKDE